MKSLLLVVLLSNLVFISTAISGDIQCWGDNSIGQLNVPGGLIANRLQGTAKQVLPMANATCILNDRGRINCWGAHTDATKFLMSLTDVIHFAVGPAVNNDSDNNACALTKSGVKCLDINGTPPDLDDKASIQMGYDYACALYSGGVTCWGAKSPFESYPRLLNPRKIIIKYNTMCILDDNGLYCAGADMPEKISALRHPKDLAISNFITCAVDDSGNSCWSTFPGSSIKVPDISPTEHVKSLVAGRRHICALSDSGVRCWGEGGELNVPHLSHPTTLITSAVANQTCSTDDSGLVCWGNDAYGESSFTPFDSISAGYANTCISYNGELNCWGKATPKMSGLLKTSDGTNVKDVLNVSVGSNYACAFNVNGMADHACWGDNSNLISQAPASTDNSILFLKPYFSAGFDHACYTMGGGVQCFGANDYGQSTPPAMNAKSLSSGGRHTCAIGFDNTLKCWGENRFGQSDAPKNLKNPREISSGFQHTCVLDDNGVKCWGRDSEGQSSVPALVNPRHISSGGYHTCAIDDTGAHCWGDNSFGQLKVPASLGTKISSLVTGYLHSCAVAK